jgi:hypothetical protein
MPAVATQNAGHRRLASRQRAGLVEGDESDARGAFQRLGVANQDSRARRGADARHDGRRGRKPERAGAGDHQDRDGCDDRSLRSSARGQPRDQAPERDREHDGHEHRRDPVHELLHRRARGLGGRDQRRDACEPRLAADRRHPQHDAAIEGDGAGRNGISRALLGGAALAGERRLVHACAAFADRAVGRDALAWAHDDEIVDAQELGGDGLLASVLPSAAGFPRGEGEQGRDRGAGRALGAPFQEPPEPDEGDDEGGGLEVQVMRVVPGQQHPQRQQIGRRGADRDQQVHVARPGARRGDASPVEAGAEHDLDRRGERQLRPARRHPVGAKRHAEHADEERRGEQRKGEQPRCL